MTSFLTYRSGAFSILLYDEWFLLKYANAYSINRLPPCVPRFLKIIMENQSTIQRYSMLPGGIEPPLMDFQSITLPSELQEQKYKLTLMIVPMGIEHMLAWGTTVLATWPRNHFIAERGIEPPTFWLWAKRATTALLCNSPYGNRTHVCSVKGYRLKPLD